MAVPDFQAFMLPLLSELADGQEHKLQDLYVVLAQKANLSEGDKNELLPSGKQRVYHSRIGWARTYLKKAGLLETVKRAVFKITEPGKQLLATQPTHIEKSMLEQYPSYLEFLQKTNIQSNQPSQNSAALLQHENAASLSPTDQIESSFNIIHSEMCDELLAEVKNTTPAFFEKMVVELMQAIGYGGWSKDSGKATQYSSDNGIDGIINEDPLGLDTIYLQAKRYTEGVIHRPDIDKFIGALTRQGARKGVFITTSTFSSGAREAAKGLSISVVLIDGQQLAELMIKHNLGVSTKQVYQIKQIDTDYFNEEQ
jgi:restriction system protein